MPAKRLLALLLLTTQAPPDLAGIDKNGVSPQAISLPSGPGSIHGLGESFQPQLNSGAASYGIPLTLPTGTAGHAPELKLSYDAGAPNGSFGLGWTLGGLVSVTRNVDRGVPRYVDGPNGIDDDQNGVVDNAQEVDILSGMDREELVPLADGSYRAESETAFTRYERLGEGWLGRRKDGTRFELGMSAEARIEDGERVFSWLVERIVDIDGNAIELEYFSDAGSAGQKYLRVLRWGQPEATFAAVVTYAAGRPDVFTDFRAGFEVKTALRATRIDIVSQGIPARADALRGDLDGDGHEDALVRRWTLDYEEDGADGPALSLLSRVVQLGCDGATALPPLVLEYSPWIPPADAVALVIRSLGEPAEVLNSPSVELCDMNGDGLPDLLSASASQHRVAINLGMSEDGRLEWAPLAPVSNSPGIDLGSPQAHLADATADGLADLVVKVSNTRFVCFDNTSNNAWTPSAAPLRNTDTWPKWPFDGADGVASRSMDLDHSRTNDVLFTSNAGYELWMLLPGGQYAKEARIAPLLSDGQTFRFDLPGTHIADLNGDRLVDLAWVQASRVVWYPNHGRGRFGELRILPLGATLTAADIERTGFSDIDGDGLEDLTVVRPATAPQSLLYWLNRFERGLEGPRRLDGLPPALAGDTLRWADMNGNGSTDIVISNSARPAGSRVLVIELVPAGKPHVLTRAANGLGLVTALEHETSVQQMVRARREGRAWSSAMQLSIPVVRRIVEDDSLGNVNVREMTYRDPFWDPEKQEFRGFRAAELREVGDETASDRTTRHLFDAGVEADCMKGKLLLEEVLDETGKVHSRTESVWEPRVLATGNDLRPVCFAFASATATLLIEGSEDAATTRVELDFDDYGNATVERNLGVVETGGDEVVVVSEYELRPESWIMDRLSRKVTFDGQQRRVAEQRLHYDARGHLVRQEAWLDTENRFVVTLLNRYDAFGNLVEAIDANGRRRTLELDGLLHAYTTREVIHLEDRDLSTTASYDLAFGVVTAALDFAGAETRYDYDPLGRLVAARRPGGSDELHAYSLATPVSHTLTRVVEDEEGHTHDSFTFFDGYGRQLAKKVEDEGGRWRVLAAVAYNGRKLPSRRWLSWLSDTSGWEAPDVTRPHAVERFDAQGRSIEVRLSDGSLRRTVHEPLVVHIQDAMDTAGAGRPESQRLDGLGRLREVTQRIGTEELVTRYEWSAQGDLVKTVDAQGNVRSATFDSLRRKIAVDDPDGGRKTYAYDDAGNLLRTVEADGTTVEYSYDLAGRLLTEDHVDPMASDDPVDVRYRYDAPSADVDFGDGTRASATFTTSRLASVADLSGEEHLSYDARGNTVWCVKRIRDPRLGVLASYATRFEHDPMDRVVGVTYPDGDRVRYAYGGAALLSRIDGGSQGRAIVESFGYSPTGQLDRIAWGNGVVTELTHDVRDRLRSIRVIDPSGRALLHDRFELDAVSNMTSISDMRPFELVPRDAPGRRSATFLYDDLHRLRRATYGEPDAVDPAERRGQIEYDYDSIGNLLSKRTPPVGQPGHLDARADLAFGDFAYGGGRSGRLGREAGDPPGPHAVTRAPDGRDYRYDARGNVVGIGSARIGWDAKCRLVSYEREGTLMRLAYDHSGRRVSELVTGGAKVEATYWVSQWFEVRPGNVPVKYVFNGDRRIARVKGTLDPTRERVQRLVLAAGWNPVVVAVESTATAAVAFGDDAIVRLASGRSFTPVDPSDPLPVGSALLVLVDAPRFAAVRGRYAPPGEPFALSSVEGYAAWPLLEPLVPGAHLLDAVRLHVLDAAAPRWSIFDASLPAFLAGARQGAAASAIWVMSSTPVQVDPGAAGAEDVVFYHEDHLGSTALVTDLAGAPVEETLYAPYGAILHQERAGSLEPAYGFAGKERDRSSGLMDFGARLYDASIGGFASVDPRLGETDDMEPDELREFLADPRKLSAYAYAGGNPLRFIDPDGQEFEAVGPQADAFVDMVSRESGLDLQRDEAGRVTIDPDGLINPYVSETLQNLVLDIVHSDKLVRITAVNKTLPQFFVDTFNRNANINPARTVHMKDFRDVQRRMPEVTSPFLGHVLAEYFRAARPRGQPVISGQGAFRPAHEHAFKVEAQIASEVTGRRLWSPRADRIRPSDYFSNGQYVVDYGPNLRYAVRFHPNTHNIQSVYRLPSKGEE